jgi:hypothetical protein
MSQNHSPPPAMSHTRQREDGWTPEVQQAFLMALIEEGSVRIAANRVDRHVTSAYRLRLRAPEFARAWDAARRMAYAQLRDVAIERAIEGTPQEVWHDGQWIGMKRVRNDRLLMNLLTHLKYESAPNAAIRRQPDDIEDERSNALARDLDALAALPPTPLILYPAPLRIDASMV